MVSVMSLWLPILLSAVIVFFVSWLIHMLLPYHRGDQARLPDEGKVMDALRPFNIAPGDYGMPCAKTSAEMKSSDFLEKCNQGPIAFITVLPTGPIAMGASLAQWFIYCLVVSVFAAYIGTRAAGPNPEYLSVFRFIGATAFIGYSLALVQNSIWYRRKWSTSFKHLMDGLIYALLTAGTFGWLWPS